MLKKNLLLAAAIGITALTASTMANAAAPGFYVGGQAGWGVTNYDKSDFGPATSVKDDGIAGRIFTGYQFDQNWAVELGFTQFSNTKARYGAADDAGNYVNGSVTLKEHAFDLVGKGILPLQNGFNVYGKAGVAYITQDPSGNATTSINGITTNYSATGDTENKLFPTFGVGISYDITPNVPVDISWNRIQKTGNSDIESTDFFSLGIAYNFG